MKFETLFSEWLRKNCMEVFHYVANVLQDVDMFDSRPIITEEENTGAIYNDFDSNPLDLLGGISNTPCYSQSSNLDRNVKIGSDDDVAPKQAIEHALLEGDKHESIFVDFLAFKSDLYDITTQEVDLAYLEKVYRIATVQNEDDFHEEIEIDDDVTDIYSMRYRNNWQGGADSVYDAWLLIHGYRRKWFPYSRFFRKYPHAKEVIEERRMKYNHIIESSTDDDEPQPTTSKRKAQSQTLHTPKKYLTEAEVLQFFK